MIHQLINKIKNDSQENHLESFFLTENSFLLSNYLSQVDSEELHQYPHNIYEKIKNVRGKFNYYKVLRQKKYLLNSFPEWKNTILDEIEKLNEISKNPFAVEIYHHVLNNNLETFFNKIWLDVTKASYIIPIKQYFSIFKTILDVGIENNVENRYKNILLVENGFLTYYYGVGSDINFEKNVVLSTGDYQSIKNSSNNIFQLRTILKNLWYYGGTIEDGNVSFINYFFKNLEAENGLLYQIQESEKIALNEILNELIFDMSFQDKLKISDVLKDCSQVKSLFEQLPYILEEDILNSMILESKTTNKVKKF